MPTAPVDVIIPLYNVERFIGDAVRSVLAQTLPPERILVVDDGSTDGGPTVVQQMASAHRGPTRIELLRKTNGGLSSARNHGIAHASAAFVAFLDADDAWAPTKLERQMACFAAATDNAPAMVYCRSHAIDERGAELPGHTNLHWEPLRGRVFDRLLRTNAISGSASAVVIRLSCLQEVGGFDEGLSALEDFDLWLRIARIGSIDLVEEDLVALRLHARNMQKDTLHMLRNMLVFYGKWFNDARHYPEVMREWSHLIAEFALRSDDRKAARRMAEQLLTPWQRRAIFHRTGGSIALHMALKRLRHAHLRPKP